MRYKTTKGRSDPANPFSPYVRERSKTDLDCMRMASEAKGTLTMLWTRPIKR
jgi:hypothetical protein